MGEDYTEETFVFTYPTCITNQEHKLKIPLRIPFQGSIEELVHRAMLAFKLPAYIEKDLFESLESTVKSLTLNFHDKKADKCIVAVLQGDLDVEDIIKNWEKIYKQRTVEYAEPLGTTDEELFAAAYHRLVHSPSLEPILQAEHKYGRDVTEVTQMRDAAQDQLTKK